MSAAPDTTCPAGSAARSRQDLLEMLTAYTQVTDRLQESHGRLRAEVARLRDELAAKNRDLRRRERLAALGQMAAGLAHEIRNPLGAISLYASLLEQDLAGRPAQVAVVRKIAAALEGLNRLVTSILEFARPRDLSRQVAPASRVVSLAVQAIQPLLEARRIRLIGPARDATLFVDPEDFARALTNLLRNAVEATGEGGAVRVRARSGRHGAVVWVEDDGPGIPGEMAERVFEPFATSKHNGTGLGLAIVHQIVEAHGGRIRAGRSRLGGARFSIRVPGNGERVTGDGQWVRQRQGPG